MRRTLTHIAVVTLVASVSAFVAGSQAAGQGNERPNIVLFLIDDLGYRDVGIYNPGTFYETPNIDRLARSGMRFTDGYAASPVCSPTASSSSATASRGSVCPPPFIWRVRPYIRNRIASM